MLFWIHSVLFNSFLSEHDTDTVELDSKIVTPSALKILWAFVELKHTTVDFNLWGWKFNVFEVLQAADYLQFSTELTDKLVFYLRNLQINEKI